MHAFIPLRTDFGYELWIGNHTGGDGNSVEAMNAMVSAPERRDFLSKGEIAYTHDKGSMAKHYIAANPGRFLGLSLKRVAQFWAGIQKGSNSTILPLTLLAFAGLVMTWRRRAIAILYLLPLLIFPLPYYITLVLVRYQYAIDTLLVVLAGYALAALLGSSKGRDAAHTKRPARPGV